ncbi:MAG: hypothetical protein NZ521_02575, partial [Flammeovirgaceae bacterium]|nr:hypothetical protein [Flammeovirgaceae bacterium]MDW8287022.1 hypothetical protein [Flammeovirgaceae bacterium]
RQHVQVGTGLVELVENGQLYGEATETVLRRFLEPMMKENVDQLVLGCTHYPFLIPSIKNIVGESMTILDPAPAVARRVKSLLEQNHLLAPLGNQPSYHFFNTLQADTMQRLLTEIGFPFVSIQIINLKEANAFYHSKKIYTTKSYRVIRDFYGNKTDEQGTLLIERIHHGISLLEKLNADGRTQEAFCLCPVLQTDENLLENYLKSFKGIESSVIILAMEYRAVAMCSTRQASPLREVNLLLFVNYLLQQKQTIEKNSSFWLEKLGIDKETYTNLVVLAGKQY